LDAKDEQFAQFRFLLDCRVAAPTEETIAADYTASIWRAQKAIILALRIGNIALNAVIAAPPRFHRLLAEPPRRRMLQLRYPIKALS
jgi:hypothetical protein